MKYFALKKYVVHVLGIVIGILMFSMFFLTIFQVFMRYVMSKPSVFAEELLRFNLIYAGLLGAAYGFAMNTHLSLSLLKDGIKTPKVQAIFKIALDGVVVVFVVGVLIVGGVMNVIDNLRQFSPILRFSMGYVYVIVPVSGILIVAFVCSNILEKIMMLVSSSKKREGSL